MPPAGAPLARSSGAEPFRDSWLLDSPFRSALRCLPGLSQLCRRPSHPLLVLETATGFPRLCRRPSHPLPGFFMASADFSLRSSGDARRPFGHKARAPQVRVVNFPAQPLDIRRHPLVVRASRTDARSPWMASPLIHRTRFLWSGCFLFVGSRFRYRFFQCRPHGWTGFPACSPCELLGVATTSSPRGLPPPIHAHAGHTSGRPGSCPPRPPTDPDVRD